MHLRHHWLHISRLQFKARSQNFNAELIPVHSPLLRESCLVSYPPLTYMLKFSGFADLTSCQYNGAQPRKPRTGIEATNSQATGTKWCSVSRKPRRQRALHASRAAESTLVRKHGQPTNRAPRPAAEKPVSSMRTKLTLKQACFQGYPEHSIRSNPCWFTEFCKSQCLSHFAAPFIVVRAETSVAESCVQCKEWTKPPRKYE